MPLIIKIIIPILITAVIGTGGVIIWKITSQPVISDLTAVATLKVNNIDGSISVPFETPITLSWESKNIDNCLVSGDWYSPVSASGSQSVGKITKPENYTLTCFDKDGKEISDSIDINIDNKTIPSEFLLSISLTDLFKDFRYFWKKELCLGLKNDPDVVALQTALFFEGILSPQEKITGNYDDDTFQAVKKFQENYGIVPLTGCVKSQTIAKLNELFYYYNYGDQLVSRESNQKQITATKQKISSYQQQIKIIPAIISPVPAPTSTSTPVPAPTKTISTTPIKTIATAKPYVDLKINNSARSSVKVQKGETATLTWTSKNTKSCIASGNWTGSKSTSNTNGEITEPINKYATFKLTCIGENNQNTADSVYVSIPYISPAAISDESKRPVIIKIVKTKCSPPIGVFDHLQCQIKIEGKNFDRHSNTIIADCSNIYCADVYDSSIKGKFGSASNGSIDIDESSGSGDSTTTSDNNSIIFEIWVRGTSNAAKINIKVQTPDGGVSNGVDTTLRVGL